MDWDKLKIFHTVAEASSFTKELSFTELLDIYSNLLEGKFFGRAIVNPNK